MFSKTIMNMLTNLLGLTNFRMKDIHMFIFRNLTFIMRFLVDWLISMWIGRCSKWLWIWIYISQITWYISSQLHNYEYILSCPWFHQRLESKYQIINRSHSEGFWNWPWNWLSWILFRWILFILFFNISSCPLNCWILFWWFFSIHAHILLFSGLDLLQINDEIEELNKTSSLSPNTKSTHLWTCFGSRNHQKFETLFI